MKICLREHLILWFVILLLCPFVSRGYAQISPGPISEAHKEMDLLRKCTSCHEIGQPIVVKRCLECHTEIQRQFDRNAGYHSFIYKEEPDKLCSDCHSEHNGREFELIHWPEGKEKFDHTGLAGYPLLGKHSELECEECHKPEYIVDPFIKTHPEVNRNRTYLGFSEKCTSCHHDPHQGEVGDNCIVCHNNSVWKPAVNFSHDAANFPLTGKHSDVACLECHPIKSVNEGEVRISQFRGIPFSSCEDCHKDPHQSRLGKDCARCHTADDWRRVLPATFDHSATRYPLEGLHQNVECQKCHYRGISFPADQFDECIDCHADPHEEQFSSRSSRGDCAECHTVGSFAVTNFEFTDHIQTRFPLTGAHLATPCRECHQLSDEAKPASGIFKMQSFACIDCHKDIHFGQFKDGESLRECTSCHITSGWRPDLFNHQKTVFPLEGAHQIIECVKCHVSVNQDTNEYRVLYVLDKTACADCHDDVHAGQFVRSEGTNPCEKCHTADTWPALIFDHDRDTKFPLDGAHAEVECQECHAKKQISGTEKIYVQYADVAANCEVCHE